MQTLHTLTQHLTLYYIYKIACKIKCAILKERLYVKGSENDTPRFLKKAIYLHKQGEFPFAFYTVTPG